MTSRSSLKTEEELADFALAQIRESKAAGQTRWRDHGFSAEVGVEVEGATIVFMPIHVRLTLKQRHNW